MTGWEEIESLTQKCVRQQVAAIDEMCERSLTDPKGRGVLVTHVISLDDLRSSTTYELSEDVPWGRIHEVYQ